MTDPEGVVTRYGYDALNRRTSMLQDEGGLNLLTAYRYDQAGNLRFLTDAENQTTELRYDNLNHLWQEIRPMGELTRYDYDEAGNLEEKLDAKGQTTTYHNRCIRAHALDVTANDKISGGNSERGRSPV